MSELLDRFCRYVKVESTAVEQTTDYPSSPGQLELGRMLVEELKALNLTDISQDEHGIVMATLPGTVASAPTIALFAHLDTSPEFNGAGVKPVVHQNYDGQDITLPGDRSRVIRVADTPELAELKGRTLISTDGTSLLGADDKAGVAVIMTAAAEMLADAGAPRCPIRVVFTCDEEVGRGVDKVDLKKVDAVVAYTLDGSGQGNLEHETFSADVAEVKITGRNIHPGLATGRMVNALRLAGQFLTRLPWRTLAPETTAGREGFLHPYHVEGGVEQANIRIILRSFETPELEQQAEMLRNIGRTIEAEHPVAKVLVTTKKQYRNMADALTKEPRAVALAAQAMRNVGLLPTSEPVRGGTDGSRLSEMGLPTPNLSTGMHNFHSPLEFAVLEEMETAVKVVKELAKLWAQEK
jgi:tripeptide aminopeptidase